MPITRCARRATSNANAENIVKPPRRPGRKNTLTVRDGANVCASNLAHTPIKKDPNTLVTDILKGTYPRDTGKYQPINNVPMNPSTTPRVTIK